MGHSYHPPIYPVVLKNARNTRVSLIDIHLSRTFYTMKSPFLYIAFVSSVIFVAAHEGHESNQMPLGYVKYPYQAVYPGDNTGGSQGCHHSLQLTPSFQ